MSVQQKLPLVYSCSGCSSAAQLANHLALRLDRARAAEMSCIAGVGGDVPALLRVATSGRRIVGIDGCALSCVRHCLQRHGLAPDLHYNLAEFGVKKRVKTDFDPQDAERLFATIAGDLAGGSDVADLAANPPA